MQSGYAQEKQDYLQDLDQIRDPFQSQLPPPKAVPVAQAVPQNISHPVNVAPPEPLFRSAPVPVKDVAQPVKQPDVKAMVIKGLVWNTTEPQAIINDKVVGVGDEVDGVEIISINQKGVEFSSKGLNFYIDLFGHKNIIEEKL